MNLTPPLQIGALTLFGGALWAAATATHNLPPQPPVAKLYEDNCAGCHGMALQSDGRAPSLDKALLSARTDDQLYGAITHGVPDSSMPAFGGAIAETERRGLVAYLRTRLDAPPALAAGGDVHGRIVDSEQQRFRIEIVARGLETPWGLAFLPDGRLLVTERPGRLRIVDKGRLSAPIKGLPAIWARQDAGLMDVTPHPDHGRNGWIYLVYADVAPGHATVAVGDGKPPGPPSPPSMTVVIRGKLDRGRWTRSQEIFRAPPSLYTRNGSHYGSRLIFDREGHLYYSLGDRGEIANAQNLASPLGKIHRVNDDGSTPRDNPFVGRPGAIATIWSYGHRNPQGLSWDPVSGALWASEHGPGGGDEINIVERGRNYGWGLTTMGVQAGMSARAVPGTEPPIVHYSPRIAPSGIAFSSSSRYPSWRNDLFVAGLGGLQLRRLEISGRRVTGQEVVLSQFGRMRTIATGPDGLLYIAVQNPTGGSTGIDLSASTPGMIIRLVPVA